MPKLSSVRAITFDLDDTLWDIWPIVARAEQRLHDWLMEHHPEVPRMFTPLAIRELGGEIARNRPDIAHDGTTLRKEALRLAALRAGCEEGFCADTAFGIFFAARNEVEFFADVLPVLQRLAQRYRLGALTNGNADIRLVGLGELFDFSISAIDIGVAKPDRAVFEAGCRLLQLAPEQIVHVGDDPEHDVLGAAQAGLRTVWINRSGRSWPGGKPADAEIKSLKELEPVLKSWECSS